MRVAHYEPAAIANGFLEKSAAEGRAVTPMKLLKLVYITHGWHLAVNGEPILDEAVQAWKYGPVIPSLFHEFKRYGSSPIAHLAQVPVNRNPVFKLEDLDFETEAPFVDDSDTKSLIDWVWIGYGHMSGLQLSNLTHQPNTPWTKTVEKMREEHPGVEWVPNTVIENPLIREHYLELWNKRTAGPA